MKVSIIIAEVIEQSKFSKCFDYSYSSLDLSNLKTICLVGEYKDKGEARYHLWDYTKHIRGAKSKYLFPECLRFLLGNTYSSSNSQFIEAHGDVAWFDNGTSIYVMYRKVAE